MAIASREPSFPPCVLRIEFSLSNRVNFFSVASVVKSDVLDFQDVQKRINQFLLTVSVGKATQVSPTFAGQRSLRRGFRDGDRLDIVTLLRLSRIDFEAQLNGALIRFVPG